MFCKIAFFPLRNITKNTLNSFYQDESEILFHAFISPKLDQFAMHFSLLLPRRRGGEIPRRHPSSSPVYIEKYLQLKYTISIAEKNLDLLDQGPHRIVG